MITSLSFLFLGGIIIDDFDSDLKTRKMNNQQSGVLRKQEYFNKRLRYYIINLSHITHKPWCIAYFIGYMWIFVVISLIEIASQSRNPGVVAISQIWIILHKPHIHH